MDEKEFRESQTRHAKFQTGILTANAFNLKKCTKAMERAALEQIEKKKNALAESG